VLLFGYRAATQDQGDKSDSWDRDGVAVDDAQHDLSIGVEIAGRAVHLETVPAPSTRNAVTGAVIDPQAWSTRRFLAAAAVLGRYHRHQVVQFGGTRVVERRSC